MRNPVVARAVPVALAALILAALVGLPACARRPEPGDPIGGLTREQRRRFDLGRAAFTRTFAPETGLGPLFNADSCAECHEEPAAGGPGDEVEVHATALLPGGACDPLADAGGPVFQQRVTPALEAALGITEEPVPARATSRARRSTPDILGFGLLDAVPEAIILSYADPADRDGDGVSGRPNRFVDGRVGRFGRKAFVPTLRQFNDGAFLIEQGITSPAAPAEESIGGRPVPPGVDPVADPEVDQETLDRADDFVRFLAPPAPLRPTASSRRGERVFARLGCVACHVPRLRTGPSEVGTLAHHVVAAYTDLLLHDMGPDLADICLGQATPSEFRTEPLMGLRLSETFLHDGRASSIDEAIRLHGGEGTRSRNRFDALSDADRRALLAFLAAL